MKVFLLILIFVCSAVTHIPAQTQKLSEEIMQGTWIIQGGGENKTPQWFLEWTFENGKFTLTGYPTIKQMGRYRVIKAKAGKLTLELFDQKGDLGTKTRQIVVVVSQKTDMLEIKDKGPFRRVINKQGSY